MGGLGEFLNIQHRQGRVGDGLTENGLGVGAEGGVQFFRRAVRVHKGKFNAHPLHGHCEQVEGTPVNAGRGHHMVPAGGDVEHGIESGRLAGGGEHGRRAALQGRDLGPDCMPDTLLDYFSALSQKKFVIIEYGLESTLDRTLTRINRGHTHAESEEAIRRTAARNIYTGAHLILGLPGESREEILHHADILSALPLTTLKLHQLQLIRGTRMAREQAEHPEQFHLYTADEYIDLVIDFIERLNPSIVVERFVSQSPKELLIAPDWGLKNFEFTAKVNKRISERNARQGRLLNPPSSEPVLPGM